MLCLKYISCTSILFISAKSNVKYFCSILRIDSILSPTCSLVRTFRNIGQSFGSFSFVHCWGFLFVYLFVCLFLHFVSLNMKDIPQV
jgi:hypothetical protein